ncbi:hypothetical protein [Burkholderia stagnalis]|uniref:hypothetical protein n=1 Tax=Burkholderia stagnalis TaxID=1503054 RepID=UPI0035D674EB
MALHTQLPIYRAAEDLLDVVTDVVTNMQRNFKRSVGEKINFECIEIIVLVYRANVAGDKSPHLTELIERLQVINLLLRLGLNKRKVDIRYVDDFIFLHESPARLNDMLADVTTFLPARLGVCINPRKTILQPIDRGVDFVGQVIKPWRRSTRKRTRNEALRRVAATPAADLMPVANSYFGLLRQATASHEDRAQLANVLRSRGHSIDRDLVKTFRKGVKA